MSKYRFRLETLAKVRSLERDQQRQRLADAYRADAVLAEQRDQLGQELDGLRAERRAAMAGEYLDVNRLTAAGRYEPVLLAQQKAIDGQQQMLDEEIERRRQALVEADRGVRALELLDERHRAAHRQQEIRAETKELDEVGCRQWLARR